LGTFSHYFWRTLYIIKNFQQINNLQPNNTSLFFKLNNHVLQIQAQLTSSFQFLFLAYHYNQRSERRRDSFHLSTRYQFRENVQILRSLLPPISFFILSDIAGLVCIWYALIWHRSDQNIRLVLQVSVKVFFVGFG
jgi:hypothetical protein